MLGGEFDSLVARLIESTLNPRRLTRGEKKWIARQRKKCRKNLVRVAGGHITRSASQDHVRAHLWPTLTWRFPKRGISVPRSLRFALGRVVGAAEKVVRWSPPIGQSWMSFYEAGLRGPKEFL